jgi:hypothetical protein
MPVVKERYFEFVGGAFPELLPRYERSYVGVHAPTSTSNGSRNGLAASASASGSRTNPGVRFRVACGLLSPRRALIPTGSWSFPSEPVLSRSVPAWPDARQAQASQSEQSDPSPDRVLHRSQEQQGARAQPHGE